MDRNPEVITAQTSTGSTEYRISLVYGSTTVDCRQSVEKKNPAYNCQTIIVYCSTRQVNSRNVQYSSSRFPTPVQLELGTSEGMTTEKHLQRFLPFTTKPSLPSEYDWMHISSEFKPLFRNYLPCQNTTTTQP